MKVLVISHNPFSTYNNMGKTFISLFKNFNKDEICQLYVYPSIPDVECCSSYFRILDKDVVKSYFSFRVCSNEIKPDINQHKLIETESYNKILQKKDIYRPMIEIVRDVFWKFSKWYSLELKKWLNDEKPSVIFVAPGRSKFLYNMAIKISKENKIPIITYICDDFYFNRQSSSLVGKFSNFLLRRKIRELLTNSNYLVTICDSLREKYCDEFNVKSSTIMTGMSFFDKNNVEYSEHPKELTYMGNLGCNRYKSLIQIGQALTTINDKYNDNYILKIYSGDMEEKIISELNAIDSIEFCGYVEGETYRKTFKSAEVLVHVEAFDEPSIERVKYSLSTKIADMLGSGKRILVYGPEGVESVNYLKKNNCATVITSERKIEEELEMLFYGTESSEHLIKNSLKIAAENHDSIRNSTKLYSILKCVSCEKGTYDE